MGAAPVEDRTLTQNRHRRSMLPALMLSTIVLRTQPDDQLAAFAASGSEAAFEAIVQRYRRELLRYCTRLLVSPARAEDAVQQTLLAAWRALQSGTEVTHLRPWLYRITHNQAMNALSRPGWDFDELSDSLSGHDAPEDDLERRQLMRETLIAVAALPDSQREALLRTAVEGESYATIATEMGVTDTAVRGLVQRARVNLRAAVAAVSPTPLVLWAARGARRPHGVLGSLTDALTTTGGAGATAGAGTLAVKSAVVAASSALLVGGGVATHAPPSTTPHARSPVHASHQRTAVATPGHAATVSATTSTRSTTAGAPAAASDLRGASPPTVHRNPAPRGTERVASVHAVTGRATEITTREFGSDPGPRSRGARRTSRGSTPATVAGSPGIDDPGRAGIAPAPHRSDAPDGGSSVRTVQAHPSGRGSTSDGGPSQPGPVTGTGTSGPPDATGGAGSSTSRSSAPVAGSPPSSAAADSPASGASSAPRSASSTTSGSDARSAQERRGGRAGGVGRSIS